MEKVKMRKTVAVVKGQEIEFVEKYLVDSKTNEEIFNRNIEIENDIQLYDIYKKRSNLLTSKEIKQIRKKYMMNQKYFALALGLGDITIHRFENGSIQTDAVDAIIRLSNDPDIMYVFLEKNHDSFKEKDYVKFIKIVNEYRIYKEHRIANIEKEEFKNINFKTENVELVAKKVIEKYNKRIDELSLKYNVCDNYMKNEYITPLKLQKLLYYIQGLSSYIYEKKAFNSDIYAWTYGPVVKEIYQSYNGRKQITGVPSEEKITDGLDKIIDITINSYGQIEAETLINLTHNEKPWVDTKINEIIDFEVMKTYFKNVYDNRIY